MTRRATTSGWLALVLFGLGVAGPAELAAQSAADKATARQLATSGIQLFRQDRFVEALDKLERAESLFDAPVHLLYIARCQTKLNHLVEAAEAYRKLLRTELSAQAPQTFKDAMIDGQKELAEVEPKVPTLRVDVSPDPAKEKDFKLTIDGEAVSSAVLGVDRPINPGAHIVEVSAKGRQPASRRVEVAVASKQGVKLELPSAGDTSTASTTPLTGNGGDPAAGNNSGVSSSATSEASVSSRPTSDGEPYSRRLRIIAGLDLAASIPFAGKLDNQPGAGSADNRDITGRYGPGGGLELKVGLSVPIASFALTPLLYVNAFSNTPGPLYKKPANESFGLNDDYNSVMTAKPISTAIGVGVRLDNAPARPWSLGGFGELSAIVRQNYVTDGTWKRTAGTALTCDFTEEYSGFGLRTRGGVLVPVSRVVTLVGSASFALTSITKGGMTKTTCEDNATWPVEPPQTVLQNAAVPSSNRAWHATFGLGLGVEFGIGL
ncbi:MAG TPA: hypothetical protein VIV60_37160 [Polyangiaceae bacterium]